MVQYEETLTEDFKETYCENLMRILSVGLKIVGKRRVYGKRLKAKSYKSRTSGPGVSVDRGRENETENEDGTGETIEWSRRGFGGERTEAEWI